MITDRIELILQKYSGVLKKHYTLCALEFRKFVSETMFGRDVSAWSLLFTDITAMNVCECQKMRWWYSVPGETPRVTSVSLSHFLSVNLTITPRTVRYRASRRPAVCHRSIPSRFVRRHSVLGYLRRFSTIDNISFMCHLHVPISQFSQDNFDSLKL